MIRAPFVGAVVVLVVVVVFAMAAILSNTVVTVDSYPRLDSYRSSGDRSIVLTVAVAPRSWTRITNVAESDTQVQITVETLTWPVPLPGTADAELRELTVILGKELGSRIVRDARGNLIPERP